MVQNTSQGLRRIEVERRQVGRGWWDLCQHGLWFTDHTALTVWMRARCKFSRDQIVDVLRLEGEGVLDSCLLVWSQCGERVEDRGVAPSCRGLARGRQGRWLLCLGETGRESSDSLLDGLRKGAAGRST